MSLESLLLQRETFIFLTKRMLALGQSLWRQRALTMQTSRRLFILKRLTKCLRILLGQGTEQENLLLTIQIRLPTVLWITFRLFHREHSNHTLTELMRSLPKNAGIWQRIYTATLFPNMLLLVYSASLIQLSVTALACFMLLQSVLLRKVSETVILLVQEALSVHHSLLIWAVFPRLILLLLTIIAENVSTANFSCTENTARALTFRLRTVRIAIYL